MKRNPFHALEALQEHVSATFVRGGIHELHPDSNEPIRFRMGSVPYHLAAIRMQASALFQHLAFLMPEQYAAYLHEEEEETP
jgi:hypothetical protein